MTKYTVVWHPSCETDIAEYWLGSSDPSAVANAANRLDAILAYDAQQQGIDLHEGLRIISIPPLSAIFSVSQRDLVVTVWKIKISGRSEV